MTTQTLQPPATARQTGTEPETQETERPIRKILAAVDHPHHAALKMALKLATAMHAQVAVILVYEPLAVISTESAVLYTDEMETQLQLAKDALKTIEKEIPEHARAFACLREGTASTEILAAAQEWDADLIVMGTHRRGAIARALLGSTSQSVVRAGKLPVLLVSDVEASEKASAATRTKGT